MTTNGGTMPAKKAAAPKPDPSDESPEDEAAPAEAPPEAASDPDAEAALGPSIQETKAMLAALDPEDRRVVSRICDITGIHPSRVSDIVVAGDVAGDELGATVTHRDGSTQRIRVAGVSWYIVEDGWEPEAPEADPEDED